MARRIAGIRRNSLPKYVLYEDLLAAAHVGLWRSALKHHRLPPAEFEAVAIVRIRGAIADELRSQDWLTRYARASFGQGLSRLHVDALKRTDSIRELSVRPDIEGDIDRADLSRELAEAVARLPKRERFIVRSLLRGREMGKIAIALRLSQPRASQLLKRAVELLRQSMG